MKDMWSMYDSDHVQSLLWHFDSNFVLKLTILSSCSSRTWILYNYVHS